MTNEERDRLLEQLLDARTSTDVGAGHPHLDVKQERELSPLLFIADLLWEAAYVPPPIESDPVALMLGLVPNPQVVLEPQALSAARKKAGLNVSDLVKRLTARGWEVRSSEVFRWETQGAPDLSPALIGAVAEELNTSIERIASRSGKQEKPEWQVAVVDSPAFAVLAKRWADLRGIPAQLAAVGLESKMLATVNRGGRPESEQLLRSLDVFITAMERADQEGS